MHLWLIALRLHCAGLRLLPMLARDELPHPMRELLKLCARIGYTPQ
jgi:hypothetical protein